MTQNALASPSLDIQEALKVLRFRLGRDVGFRPVKRAGMSYYSVDGKLRAELEILQRVGVSNTAKCPGVRGRF